MRKKTRFEHKSLQGLCVSAAAAVVVVVVVVTGTVVYVSSTVPG